MIASGIAIGLLLGYWLRWRALLLVGLGWAVFVAFGGATLDTDYLLAAGVAALLAVALGAFLRKVVRDAIHRHPRE